MLSKMLGPVWVVLLGVVVLFGFFALLGLFSPDEVMWLTVAVAALAVLIGIRSLLMRRQLEPARQPGSVPVPERTQRTPRLLASD